MAIREDTEVPHTFLYGKQKQYGAWVIRWTHKSVAIAKWLIRGNSDTPYARAAIELTYVQNMKEIVKNVANGKIMLRTAADYEGWIPIQLDQLYFTADWDEWIHDLSFERRLRTRMESQRFLVSWGMHELFIVSVAERARI